MIIVDLADHIRERMLVELPDWQSATYLLAVSTGVDSMALLAAFEYLADHEDIKFQVVHINHRLRSASQAEQDFIVDYCQSRQIPLHVRIWQHPPLDSQVEALAREFRYANFKAIMGQEKLNYLLTGHHLNDQAETVMMRLMQGKRLEAIAGIKPLTSFHHDHSYNQIFRPLLDVSKEELYALAHNEGLTYYEDESNQSIDYFRNRLRHQTLPALEAEAPQIQSYLANFAEEAQALLSLHHDFLNQYFREHVTWDGYAYRMDISLLLTRPRRQAILILQAFFAYTTIEALRSFSQSGYQDLFTFLHSSSQGEWTLPGDYRLVKNYDFIILFHRDDRGHIWPPSQNVQLSLGQEKAVNAYLSLAFLSGASALAMSSNKQVVFYLGQPASSIYFRARQAGDYLRLTNGHHQKLRRYFINNKWPQAKRDQVQVLADDKGLVYALIWEDQVFYQAEWAQNASNQHALYGIILVNFL